MQGGIKVADAVYTMYSDIGDNPMTYMGGYFTIASVVISIAQADQQQKQAEAQAEQANVIIDAIKLLSQQIDDMRAELVSRLTQIDNTLAVNFGQQHSLLDAIVKN